MTPSGLTDEQLALTVNPTYTQDSVATVSKNLIWSNFNTQFNAITANLEKKEAFRYSGVQNNKTT